jgi:DNA-directed RNA polymerase subunit F
MTLRERLRRVGQADPTEVHDMAGALKDCRRYLTRFGSVDPEALKQQIDDALAMYELREANANFALAEKSA